MLFRRRKRDSNTLGDLRDKLDTVLSNQRSLMSQITDWAAAEQVSLNAIQTSLTNVVTGIAALDAQITALQNSPGTLSASDQAALDAIQTASAALVAQSAAISVVPPAPVAPVPPAV